MAARGCAYITTHQGWQEEGRVQFGFDYVGFTHTSEAFSHNFQVTPSLLTGAAIKASIKDEVVTWYDNHPSENYDEWDTTPIVGDTFAVIGGVL